MSKNTTFPGTIQNPSTTVGHNTLRSSLGKRKLLIAEACPWMTVKRIHMRGALAMTNNKRMNLHRGRSKRLYQHHCLFISFLFYLVLFFVLLSSLGVLQTSASLVVCCVGTKRKVSVEANRACRTRSQDKTWLSHATDYCSAYMSHSHTGSSFIPQSNGTLLVRQCLQVKNPTVHPRMSCTPQRRLLL